MIKHKTTRTWAAILAVLLLLSLLLTACSTGGDTPTGDNSTPGVTETPSNTPDATNTSPNDTTEPDNTPSNTPDAPKEPVVLLPDPEDINEEELTKINGAFTIGASSGVEVLDNMLDEAYEKYGKYLNENISKNCVKIGLTTDGVDAITPEALKKVNDLLESNGEEPLDSKDPEQKIAAIWLAASLYYDADYPNPLGDTERFAKWRFDIAQAFALTHYSDPNDIETYCFSYASSYAHLFNIYDG